MSSFMPYRHCGGFISMHHADLEFDVTTGLRFHPIEILLDDDQACRASQH
jgi:hypothetical protein